MLVDLSDGLPSQKEATGRWKREIWGVLDVGPEFRGREAILRGDDTFFVLLC